MDKVLQTTVEQMRSGRNLSRVRELSSDNFEAAHLRGVMGVSCSRDHSTGMLCTKEGRTFVDFSRCGYLGLDSHPSVLESAIDTLRDMSSIHFSVARTRLTAAPLVALESRLKELWDVKSVIVFPTVAAANMAALPLLAGGLLTDSTVKPVLVFDRFAHATLQYHIPVLKTDVDVLVIEHNDINQLEDICKKHPMVAYVGDGAYSMGGSAPVAELRYLQDRYGLFVYLDDAHGISVKGSRGQGFVRSTIDALGSRMLIAGSLGKGFGASGGFLMVGTAEQDKAIRRFGVTYAFSCAPNMPAVGAALGSAMLHETEELPLRQQRLLSNMKLFDSVVASENKGSQLPIRIIRLSSENAAIELSRRLFSRGFYTSCVFFPTVPRGKAGLRIAINALHTEKEIRSLGQEIESVMASEHCADLS